MKFADMAAPETFRILYLLLTHKGIIIIFMLMKHDVILLKVWLSFIITPHRMVPTKFGTSFHQLRIETVRYQNTDENERTCQLYKSGEVESKNDFLIECKIL